jgi:hypothetical protein
MSICYSLVNKNNNFSQRTLERYRIIDVKIMAFCININKLADIMKGILSDFCNATVIGYEKRTNKFWCKIYDKNNCSLHIELEIVNKCSKITYVKFIPIIGTDLLVENFVSNFTESIQLYTTSSFIRGLLERNIGL